MTKAQLQYMRLNIAYELLKSDREEEYKALLQITESSFDALEREIIWRKLDNSMSDDMRLASAGLKSIKRRILSAQKFKEHRLNDETV